MHVARRLRLGPILERHSVLLLGPRRTGKSALVRHELQPDRVYDLLRADVFARLAARPSLIREELQPGDRLVVVDEIQKLPALMDEVHGLIETTGTRFLLTGSSARKLRRTHTSLMAGRARTRHLLPFVSTEIGTFDLDRALHTGLLPPVWLADDAWDELESYVGDYLQEEIRAEALARRIEGFARFLHTAALANAEQVNFEAAARNAQVPARTVRDYYAVLVDTLIGRFVEPLDVGRKAVSHGKFYFFDTGVVHRLLGRRSLPDASHEYGKAFEAFVCHELHAWQAYEARDVPIRFWRTHGGQEVDFVVGDVAIEVKSTRLATEQDCKGLLALDAVKPMRRRVLVTRDTTPRRIGRVEVLPWRAFLAEVWDGGLVVG